MNSGDFQDANQFPGSSAPFAAHDLSTMKTLLDQINASGAKVAKTLTSGFGAAASSGKSFNDMLGSISQSLGRSMIREGSKTLAQGLVGSLGALFNGGFGASETAGAIAPFAEGGVVASPSYFNNGGSIGLMGERGAEAIMPLARGPDGRLGVVAPNSGARPVAVTVNIAAQDIDSFRRSEGQITSALARAVSRGQRNL